MAMGPVNTAASPREKSGRPTPLAFRTLVLGLTLVSSLLLAAFATGRVPSAIATIGLTGLMIAATHRESFFADETALSGSFIVVLAAVVLSVEKMTPLGFATCSICAGLYVTDIRSRAWSRMVVNASVHLIAASLAAASYAVIVNALTPRLLGFCVGTIAAVAAYWFANNSILGIAIAIFERVPIVPRVVDLIRSETEMLLFALGGAGCGYLMATVSPIVGLLGLVLLLIAVDVLVIRRPRVRIRVGQSARRVRSAIQIALGLAAVSTVVALLFLEPFPEAVPLAVLAGTGATVTAIGRRLPLARRLSCSAVASLAAVGAFYDSSLFLGAGLVGLAAGITLCLTESGAIRRCFVLGATVMPALAAAGAAAAIPLRASDGWGALIVVSLASALGAGLARVFVTATSLAGGVGMASLLVAFGDATADWWIVLAGTLAVAAAWHSLVAGTVLVVGVVAIAMLIEHRRAVARGHIAAGQPHGDELLDAVVAALCDRPGAPSSLSS